MHADILAWCPLHHHAAACEAFLKIGWLPHKGP